MEDRHPATKKVRENVSPNSVAVPNVEDCVDGFVACVEGFPPEWPRVLNRFLHKVLGDMQ